MLQVINSEEEVSQAIVAFAVARGNAELAAERLHIPKTLLFELISQDPDQLAHHLHTMVIMQTFEALGQTHNNLRTAIPEMEPYEKAKLYTNLLQIAQGLSQAPPVPQSTNVQVNLNQVLQSIPDKEAREALQFLITDQASEDNEAE